MAKIIGMGEWFPSQIRVNADWGPDLLVSFEKHLERVLLDLIDEKSSHADPVSEEHLKKEMLDPFVGTTARRVADTNTPSYEGEIAAAEMAIAEAGIDPTQISACYSYSFFLDMPSMSCAPHILKHFNATNAFGCMLDGACSSPLLQLMAAQALVDSGKFKYILLTQSSLFSRGLPFEHPASPNIGDAATAMLIGPDNHEGHRILNVHARSHGEHYTSVVWRRQNGDSNWTNAGSTHYLGSYDSEGARNLVQATVKLGAKTITDCMAEIGLATDNLDFLISMSPRKWVPLAITTLLGLAEHQTIEVFDKYAHLGACGALVNLLEARRQNLLTKGDKIGIYSQGAGFTRSAAVIQWLM